MCPRRSAPRSLPARTDPRFAGVERAPLAGAAAARSRRIAHRSLAPPRRPAGGVGRPAPVWLMYAATQVVSAVTVLAVYRVVRLPWPSALMGLWIGGFFVVRA